MIIMTWAPTENYKGSSEIFSSVEDMTRRLSHIQPQSWPDFIHEMNPVTGETTTVEVTFTAGVGLKIYVNGEAQ